MMEKLWGDNFWDPSTKKWTKKATGTATCKRGFVQFVYDPIKTIIDLAMNDNKKKLFEMCACAPGVSMTHIFVLPGCTAAQGCISTICSLCFARMLGRAVP